jgi:hypothetical protein
MKGMWQQNNYTFFLSSQEMRSMTKQSKKYLFSIIVNCFVVYYVSSQLYQLNNKAIRAFYHANSFLSLRGA